MTKSRRQFLATGTLAALFAALPLKAVAKDAWNKRDGFFGVLDDPDDPLANYSKATFVSYVDSVFQIQAPSGAVDATLVSVTDMPAPTGGECFSLLFAGGSSALAQNTYTVVHSALGTFQLFLVPAGANSNGAQQCRATINRVAAAP
jgi:hypothetical protein